MGKTPHKTVMLPIRVPDNDYCWDGMTPCSYFDNEGGHATCDLNIGTIITTAEGWYRKPLKCRDLNRPRPD
jgi:hypothetical protein